MPGNGGNFALIFGGTIGMFAKGIPGGGIGGLIGPVGYIEGPIEFISMLGFIPGGFIPINGGLLGMFAIWY